MAADCEWNGIDRAESLARGDEAHTPRLPRREGALPPGVFNPASAETEPLGAEAFLTDLCRGVCDSTT
jgi:hypothetical protein